MQESGPLWAADDDPALRPPPPPPPPVRPPEPPPGRDWTPALRVLAGAAIGGALAVITVLGVRTFTDDESSRSRPPATPLAATRGGTDEGRAGRVFARVGKSVVQVRRNGGSGTGWLIDTDGTIVTNAHVVGPADDVQLILDDGQPPVRGRVSGTDPSSDLAVVRVDPDDVASLRPIPLADSDAVEVGELAIAIGYPLGLQRTVTQGIVSGVGRQIEAPNGFSIDEVIQTDAPINPGNSGGPLLDARGRVIGVNSQIATAGSRGNVGIGFAVPSNTVREVVPVLRSGATVQRPYLGVSTGPTASGAPGAVVREVRPGSPAAAAGVRAAASADGADGDVIVAVGGRPVRAPEDVSRALAGKRPGDRITVTMQRGGDRVTVELELGERPESAGP